MSSAEISKMATCVVTSDQAFILPALCVGISSLQQEETLCLVSL